MPTPSGNCLALPQFPTPPGLPSGLSVSLFPGLTLPALGLCCNQQVPPWGTFPVPAIVPVIPFPAAAVTAYATFLAAMQAAYDAVAIPCPNQ